jgi:hypothetical protein
MRQVKQETHQGQKEEITPQKMTLRRESKK